MFLAIISSALFALGTFCFATIMRHQSSSARDTFLAGTQVETAGFKRRDQKHLFSNFAFSLPPSGFLLSPMGAFGFKRLIPSPDKTSHICLKHDFDLFFGLILLHNFLILENFGMINESLFIILEKLRNAIRSGLICS